MPPPDPVAALVAAFERIAATRMRGLAIANPALGVAAVGFRPWQEVMAGVLVTPWAINLALVSAEPAALRLAVDETRNWRFPSGEYAFMGGTEAECGAFQFCPLFSPVLEFATQAAAETTARAVGAELFRAPEAASLCTRPLSRRGFLGGAAWGTLGATKA